MTVREFLDIHPDADLDLRTPAGRIYLDAAGRKTAGERQIGDR